MTTYEVVVDIEFLNDYGDDERWTSIRCYPSYSKALEAEKEQINIDNKDDKYVISEPTNDTKQKMKNIIVLRDKNDKYSTRLYYITEHEGR